MIASKENASPENAPIALMDIGNATVAVGLWSGDVVSDRVSIPTDHFDEIGAALKSFAAGTTDGYLGGVAIASVVPDARERIGKWIEDYLMLEPLAVGDHIPLPIHVKLESPEAVGVDRVCAAAAAFDSKGDACVVVDCGTAVTVDVVDDEGAFIGGAILPGLGMQARALHEQTAALPLTIPAAPRAVIGDNTENAILTGIYHGTAGAIRGVVEAYATHFNRWMTVFATGGDAELIAKTCGVFDVIMPDLCLRGVGLAYNKRLAQAVTL